MVARIAGLQDGASDPDALLWGDLDAVGVDGELEFEGESLAPALGGVGEVEAVEGGAAVVAGASAASSME